MIFGKKNFFRFLWEKIRIFNFFQKSWIFFSNFFSILGKKNWKFREKIENRDFLSQKSKKNFFSKNHFFRFPRWFFSPEDFFLVLPQPSEKSKIHVYFYPILLGPRAPIGAIRDPSDVWLLLGGVGIHPLTKTIGKEC